jgi:starch-binding outer membrane protein, SusD/RagB family
MNMKKIIIHILFFLCVILIGISCNKDSLDLSPVDSATNDDVFNSTETGLIKAYVNNIYIAIPDGYNWGMLSSVSDESHMSGGSWAGMTTIMLSQLTPSNLSAFAGGGYYGKYSWANAYKNIRSTNLFLSKIDASPADIVAKNELKGEVFFLRAYYYHLLVAMHGGVPIIEKAYTLSDSFSVARNTFAECIQFISDNCDSAAKYLPLTQSEGGRATQGAALALKSRVLLYAASDLYNTPSMWGSYAHPELVSYTSASTSERQARWQKAKDAASVVMALPQYSLYKPDPASATEATDNYYGLSVASSSPEDIFVRYYTASITGNWTTMAPHTFHNPNGYHGWGTEAPTQQMVDDYEMSDGTVFNWSNATEAVAPYQNRDPRFYATVLYDRALWRARPSDVSGDPVGAVQTGHYWGLSNDPTPVPVLRDGLDTGGNNGGVDTWNAGWTGYYLKKGVDINVEPKQGAAHQTVPWRFIRYTEVLLNYAEACLGLGQEAEALTYINMIRKRAYMPSVATSGSALVKSLQHERKIELAFEELRYFDIRRWMICESAYADVQGIKILYGSSTSVSTTYGTGTPTYTVEVVDKREWDPKSYFLPIDINEMNKNYKLIQNPGY